MVGFLGSSGDVLSWVFLWFYDEVQVPGFGKIVIPGAEVCPCLYWVAVLFLGFCYSPCLVSWEGGQDRGEAMIGGLPQSWA